MICVSGLGILPIQSTKTYFSLLCVLQLTEKMAKMALCVGFELPLGSSCWIGVTWLGNFCKFLMTIFLPKVAKIFSDFLGYFKNKQIWLLWGQLVINWETFYSNIWSLCRLLNIFNQWINRNRLFTNWS